jgi:hypothetical protein
MLVVVGGHSRSIGKTSVVEGLIRRLPDFAWTALKITQYGHGICSKADDACGCTVEYDHPYAISEETGSNPKTDSGRFLAAGAIRSFWVRTPAGQLGHAIPKLRELFGSSKNTIVESNSLLQFIRPDLYLVVLDSSTSDFKASSLAHLDRADAVIVIERSTGAQKWSGVSNALWNQKVKFRVTPPVYVTDAVAEFVRYCGSGALPEPASGRL